MSPTKRMIVISDSDSDEPVTVKPLNKKRRVVISDDECDEQPQSCDVRSSGTPPKSHGEETTGRKTTRCPSRLTSQKPTVLNKPCHPITIEDDLDWIRDGDSTSEVESSGEDESGHSENHESESESDFSDGGSDEESEENNDSVDAMKTLESMWRAEKVKAEELRSRLKSKTVSAPFYKEVEKKREGTTEAGSKKVPISKAGGSKDVTSNTSEPKDFLRRRNYYTRELFEEFNRRIFQGRIPENLKIEWSITLRKCAGRTMIDHEKRKHKVYVELSSKILQTYERLRTTLCHELCHAAVALVDNNMKEVHGPRFFRWANTAMRIYPDMEITRCHTYEIDYKFYYKCTNSRCGFVYGRHSRSINTTESGCGYCQSKLSLVPQGQKPSPGVHQDFI